jgi:hypothetical protein
MATVLSRMQALLTSLYDVPSNYNVCDFLITDQKKLSCYSDALPSDHTDEQVIVCETDEGAQISVYIDAAVLDRLAAADPTKKLSDANLSDYCTALEGVSHFHYLVWRAHYDRTVSLLELELQAEVDKYAAAMMLYTSQHDGRFPVTLHERLFDQVHYAAGLDAECKARYHAANSHAARFCRGLDNRYLRRRRARPEAWLAELRDFYRFGQSDKVRRAMR